MQSTEETQLANLVSRINLRYESIESQINDLDNEYEIPIFGPDKLIDIKRMNGLFTIVNNTVLLKANNPKSIWSALRNSLKQKGDPIYRSAKNIVLAYRYIMMTNQQRKQLINFFNSKDFRNRYEDFSAISGLTVKTLKNYSDYIGTPRFQANIEACIMLCKRFAKKRDNSH